MKSIVMALGALLVFGLSVGLAEAIKNRDVQSAALMEVQSFLQIRDKAKIRFSNVVVTKSRAVCGAFQASNNGHQWSEPIRFVRGEDASVAVDPGSSIFGLSPERTPQETLLVSQFNSLYRASCF